MTENRPENKYNEQEGQGLDETQSLGYERFDNTGDTAPESASEDFSSRETHHPSNTDRDALKSDSEPSSDDDEMEPLPPLSRRDRRAKKDRKRLITLWVIVGILAVAVGIIAFLAFGIEDEEPAEEEVTVEEEDERVSVPAAVGSLSIDEDESFACERYEYVDLECIVEFEVSDSIPRGNIISQSPEAGQFVDAGSEVVLTYSSGPETSEFPDISNESLEYAEEVLWTIGVEIEDTEYISNSGIVENRVVSAADVEEGDTISNGESVVINLSDGTIEIPDWTGQTRADVELEAEELGVDVAVFTEESESDEGIVLDQDQSGEVNMNDVIEITVAIPFESVEIEVPDVLDMSPDDAQYDLAEAGFRNITSITVDSAEVDEPTVTQVVPGVGSTGLSGERIVIVVSEPNGESDN